MFIHYMVEHQSSHLEIELIELNGPKSSLSNTSITVMDVKVCVWVCVCEREGERKCSLRLIITADISWQAGSQSTNGVITNLR